MNAKTMKKDDLKSGPNIAKILDLDPATIRRWAREGCPQHEIAPGLIRYKLDEVLAWRASRKGKEVVK